MLKIILLTVLVTLLVVGGFVLALYALWRKPGPALGIGRMIDEAISEQGKHEKTLHQHHLVYRDDQRAKAIAQRVEQKLGKKLSGNAHQAIVERIKERLG